MTSKQSRLAAAVVPTLAGLSLAAAIAREAADAVPVVKQGLGVVVRILALVEKIDKDREALHTLADKSARLALRVKDVLGDDEPDAILLPSLERMYNAFEDVEKFMEKHIARNCFSRGLGYAFTVNHHVGRLSRNLENALQEVLAMTVLVIKQDAQYVGEFRRIRDCQVDKLELLREDRHEEAGSNLVIRYHKARVDDKLLVVRYFEGDGPQNCRMGHPEGEAPYDRVASYDLILKELSTVRGSHPNVARLYGWGTGSIYNRFTVFKSGFRDVHELSEQLPNTITTLIHCACKVLAAGHHIERMGLAWEPDSPPYVLDDRLEPIIGLQDDLCRSDSNADPVFWKANQIFYSTSPIWHLFPSQAVAAADVQQAVAHFHNEQLNNVLGRFETVRRLRREIPKANFSTKRILNDDTAEGLLVAVDDVSYDSWRVQGQTWASILSALDKNRGHRLKNGLRVVYSAGKNGNDFIDIYEIDEDSEQIVYAWYRLHIPDFQADEVRDMLGIPPPPEELTTSHLIATGGLGTYRAPA